MFNCQKQSVWPESAPLTRGEGFPEKDRRRRTRCFRARALAAFARVEWRMIRVRRAMRCSRAALCRSRCSRAACSSCSRSFRSCTCTAARGTGHSRRRAILYLSLWLNCVARLCKEGRLAAETHHKQPACAVGAHGRLPKRIPRTLPVSKAGWAGYCAWISCWPRAKLHPPPSS